MHSSIASCWRGMRGVNLIAAWIFETRDADTLNCSATVVSGSFGLARCKVKKLTPFRPPPELLCHFLARGLFGLPLCVSQ